MTNRGTGFLAAIEHQKVVHSKKFNELLKGREMRNDGDLSIAADRGILKLMKNSSSFGYNTRMKIINDKIALQIMDKYKNNFADTMNK